MNLRERRKQRARPATVWPLRIDEVDRVAELRTARDQADNEVRIATIAYAADAPELVAARERAEAVRRDLVACYEPIELQALVPTAYEELVAEHPSEEQGSDDAWGKDFPRALFLACAQGDLTAEEWASLLDEDLTPGEREDLLNTVLELHLRLPDPHLPKDWTSTRS